MENRLKKLKQKIRELCPELMELTSGCKIRSGGQTYIVGFDYGLSHEGTALIIEPSCNCPDWEKYNKVEYLPIHEIIGHPVTLEHILKIYLDAKQIYSYIKQKELWDWGVGRVYRECAANILLKWHFGKPWESQTVVHKLLYEFFNIK